MTKFSAVGKKKDKFPYNTFAKVTHLLLNFENMTTKILKNLET